MYWHKSNFCTYFAIEMILKYIEENYHSRISKIEIENLAFCSQRTIQRLFKRFLSETINRLWEK